MLTVALLCLPAFSVNALAAPIVQSDTVLSTAGYFRISWTNPKQETATQTYELQQANTPEFINADVRYQGPDSAVVISGLSNQTYYYRVRNAGSGEWSNTISVEVKHHSLSRAFGFFTLGIVMFIATVAVLISGARKGREL